MNKIALDVLEKFYEDGFWISEKMPYSQYKTAKQRLKLLDKDGYETK